MKILFFMISLLTISSTAFAAPKTIFDNPSVKDFLLKHYIHGDDYKVEYPTILSRKVLVLTSIYNNGSRTGGYKNVILDSNTGTMNFSGNNLKISIKINRPTFQNVALFKIYRGGSELLANTTTFEGSTTDGNQFDINLSGTMIINNQITQINLNGCESFTVDSENRLVQAFGCSSGEIADEKGAVLYQNVGYIYIDSKGDSKYHEIIGN